jgi:small subunit ribosomal protein S6
MSQIANTNYETIYILRPGLQADVATSIHTKLDTVVSKFEGAVEHREDWGMRELAYEIDDERSGNYHIVVYNGKAGVVEEIERHFRIAGDVIRYLTVKLPKGYDYALVKKRIAETEEEVKRQREAKKKGLNI